MGKQFRITEEQYNKMIKEGIAIDVDPSKTNGNIQAAIEDAKKSATSNNVDIKNVEFKINGNSLTQNESRLITKKELTNNRLKALKEASQLFTVKDFVKSNFSKLNEDTDSLRFNRFDSLSDEIEYYEGVFDETGSLSQQQIKALKEAGEAIAVFGEAGQNYYKLSLEILKQVSNKNK